MSSGRYSLIPDLRCDQDLSRIVQQGVRPTSDVLGSRTAPMVQKPHREISETSESKKFGQTVDSSISALSALCLFVKKKRHLPF